jgi:DNA invertase Pin-like site-specific DNA recombinase
METTTAMQEIPKKVAAIYTRVSTESQDANNQIMELELYVRKRNWIPKIYKDIESGMNNDNRPHFKELLADAQKRIIDIVIVWSVDRLARDMKCLINAIELFKAVNVEFISYKQLIDTTTPNGRLLFHIFGALNEYEHFLFSERVKSGMKKAKKKGIILGRPSLDPWYVRKILRLRRSGKSYGQIAKILKCKRGRVCGVCRRELILKEKRK